MQTQMLPFSIRMEGYAVDWSKMTLDPTKFFLENHVVKSGIKFSNSCRCRCDIHSFLSTTQHNLYTSY